MWNEKCETKSVTQKVLHKKCETNDWNEKCETISVKRKVWNEKCETKSVKRKVTFIFKT